MTSYRHWSLQLYKDFDDTCFQFKLKLKRPLINIVDSSTFWGRWDPLYRKIELSSQLITLHDWDTVLKVFKHEIAHQIVHEIYGLDDSTHGKNFQHACDHLGLEPLFRSASGDLPQEFSHWKLQMTDNPTLNKVEKLFSLAQSTNENESALAMQKAQNILNKYNLKRISDKTSANYAYLIINKKKKRIQSWQNRIGSLLVNYYFVEVILSDLYDAEKNESHKTIEILGTQENVLIAEYIYHYLESTLESMWAGYKSTKGAPASQKCSYYLGLLAGFEKKLDLIKQKQEAGAHGQTPQQNGLLLTHDQQLGDYIGRRFPRLRKRSGGRGRFHAQAFSSGKSQGQSITIKKGISTTSSTIKGFLTGSQ